MWEQMRCVNHRGASALSTAAPLCGWWDQCTISPSRPDFSDGSHKIPRSPSASSLAAAPNPDRLPADTAASSRRSSILGVGPRAWRRMGSCSARMSSHTKPPRLGSTELFEGRPVLGKHW